MFATAYAKAKKYAAKAALAAPAVVGSGIMAAQTAAVNLTPVADLLAQVADLIPSIVDLAIAAMPAIIIFGVIGFVLTFLDDILASLRRV